MERKIIFDRTRLDLIGRLVEVAFTKGHPLETIPQTQSVWAVRGADHEMICLELYYEPATGVHQHDRIFWVSIFAIAYLRVISEQEAHSRAEGELATSRA